MESNLLFNDFEATAIDINSVWRQEKKVREIEQQTDPIPNRRKETQSIDRSFKEVQTISEATEFRLSDDYDAAALSASLRELSSFVEDQLERNLRSHAFDGQ